MHNDSILFFWANKTCQVSILNKSSRNSYILLECAFYSIDDRILHRHGLTWYLLKASIQLFMQNQASYLQENSVQIDSTTVTGKEIILKLPSQILHPQRATMIATEMYNFLICTFHLCYI